MSKIDNFPYPTPIPAKIRGCSLWSRSFMLGSAESEMVRLISREIIFLQNSNLYDHDTSTPQTDRSTDRQTTCLDNTALRVASRGKKQMRDYDNNFGLVCEGPIIFYRDRNKRKSPFSKTAQIRRPSKTNTCEYPHTDCQKPEFLGYICASDSMGLSSSYILL